jgi:tetratricopeptide (TPR) repeat protein
MTAQEDIVRTVAAVTFPLPQTPLGNEAAKGAVLMIMQIVEGAQSESQVRLQLKNLLAAIGYKPEEGEKGTLADLGTDARLDLFLDTAVSMARSHGQWQVGHTEAVLEVWPAQELCRATECKEPRDWPAQWAKAGGQFFNDPELGPPDYSEGHMIAPKNSDIWIKISAFGLPYAPFDFRSWVDTRDIDAETCHRIGLDIPEEAVTLPDQESDVLGMHTGRLPAMLRQRLSELEDEDQRRRTNPMVYGTGSDLLRLAEKRLAESEGPTSACISEIRQLADTAVRRGFGDDAQVLSEASCSLARIYEAIKEPEKAAALRQKALEQRQRATELRIEFLVSQGSGYDLIKTAEGLLADNPELTPEVAKQILRLSERAFELGIDDKYSLRPKAHRLLAEVYRQTKEPEKAEESRARYVESANGVMLLEDARAQIALLGDQAEPALAAPILDLLTRAVQRLPADRPSLHADAYRATAVLLEAIGDQAHAAEYYECALQMNPKIAVKSRLKALKKALGTD